MRTLSTVRSHSSDAMQDHNDKFDDWHEVDRPPRDWKKALLLIGLGALSWVATYVGMLELIQSNMGDLPLINKIIVGFSVAMLMVMIIWLLDQMFAPLPFLTKFAYLAGYVFLTMISVGFGFGFYWKVLESRSEASRSAESAVTQVKTALYAASARLDQLQLTLDQLTQISVAKASEERERGTTCPNSRPGDGPRRRLRDADAARFAFAAQFVKGRVEQSKDQMKAMDVDLRKIANADPATFDPKTGTRNKFLQELTRRLELTATSFNAFRTDPQLRQIRTELAERATKTRFPTSTGRTFSCPDPHLQSALRGVVQAIDKLPELGKPQIATVEGAQAVVEAFRRLATTFYGVLTFKLPPSSDELRAMQQRAVQSLEANTLISNQYSNQGGLSKRDYIPLTIALFVDICLLLVSIGRPMNRLHGLIPKMREAERGPVYQILSRFGDIHRNGEILQKFEIFRHVVFDFHGDYYVAVPLDAPPYGNPEERLGLQQEAHLLGNLFASFEKEKIFSRVYNPMLTRHVIKKKLMRQGSKFAESQAFRTYRFRDGAWSEIILGAVMGAARHMPAKSKTIVLETDLPEQTENALTMTNADETLGADEIPGMDNQDASILTRSKSDRISEPPPTQTPQQQNSASSPQYIDPLLREKYGTYADFMAENSEPDEAEVIIRQQPDKSISSSSYIQADDLQDWYSEPPAFAAAQQQHAAAFNSPPDQQLPNQSFNEDPGNVIPMKTHLKPLSDRLQAPTNNNYNVASSAQNLFPEQEEAAVLPSSSAETSSSVPHTTAPMPLVSVSSQEMPPPSVAEPESETNINVRITERTADFTVPVTEAWPPNNILSDLEHFDAHNQPVIDDNSPSTQNPMLIEEAVTPTDEIADQLSYRLVEMDQQTEDTEKVEVDDNKDDDLMELAQRFVQTRTPAE